MKKKYLIISLLFIFSYLYSYSQTPGEWTWMCGDSIDNVPAVFGIKGVANATNHPEGLYEAGGWTDLQGNFWIFGGKNSSNKIYGDLWKYDPLINMWTWMNGTGQANSSAVHGIKGLPATTNQPGSRGYGMFTWTDNNGDLWLFGGAPGYSNNSVVNDLWKYNISSNMWTWMSGDSIVNSSGHYGIKGVPSVSNVPNAKNESAVAWTD